MLFRSDVPDLDNLEKTFLDCCRREGLIADDRLVVEKRTLKAWSDPAGIWFRFEEVRGHSGEDGACNK